MRCGVVPPARSTAIALFPALLATYQGRIRIRAWPSCNTALGGVGGVVAQPARVRARTNRTTVRSMGSPCLAMDCADPRAFPHAAYIEPRLPYNGVLQKEVA